MKNQPIPSSELIINDDGSAFHLHILPEDLADTVIMMGDPGRVNTIAEHFDTIELDKQSREFHTITGTYHGKRVTALSHGIGTDNIDIVMTELDALANEGDPKAKLVFKKFTYDIIKNIGSYVAAMNGVDLIIFTGGIGEHNSRLRRRVLENFSYLGLKVDYEANVAFGEDAIITTEDSQVKAALICTNEELVIARDTMHLVLDNQE